MSIEKLLVKEGIPFTQLFNGVLQNLRDTDALAIWGYLSSMPCDWIPSKAQIGAHFHMGAFRIKKAFKMLTDLGLIELHSARNESGQVIRWEIHVNNGMNIAQSDMLARQSVIDPVVNLPGSKTTPTKETTNTKDKKDKKESCIIPKNEHCEPSGSLPTKHLFLQPYIEIWNEIATQEGCPRMGMDKRQLAAIKKSIDEVKKKWDEELTPDNFKIWLNNAIKNKFYMIHKFKNRMEVCVRPEHFMDAYNRVREDEKA